MLLELGEQAVGVEGLALAHADRGRGRRLVERMGGDQQAACGERRVIGERLGGGRAMLLLGEAFEALGVDGDEAEIAHG